ncbi:MAG: dephospho-CoA kinase [Pseudoflavonifractor sp.]|nr:dephospho-CoA kinase [Pseudoflavonifractor sp.]
MTITDHTRRFPDLIAITGGIGSGKSVVARIVAAMGYEVYDCDMRARVLMERAEIKLALAEAFGADIFDEGGGLVRRELAAIVFNDRKMLNRLNDITHTAVRADLALWAEERQGRGPAFVETAILYQSRIDRMAGRVWEVIAPVETRIERVAKRSGLSREEAMARISSQDSFVPEMLHEDVSLIVNDGLTPVLPHVEHLLS